MTDFANAGAPNRQGDLITLLYFDTAVGWAAIGWAAFGLKGVSKQKLASAHPKKVPAECGPTVSRSRIALMVVKECDNPRGYYVRFKSDCSRFLHYRVLP